MPECYVCYDDCETRSNCLCKELYVHPSCVEMMKIYGKTGCGVCKQPFPEEEIEWNAPPVLCLCLPTCFRPLKYDYNEDDRVFDIIRVCFLFIILLVVFQLCAVRYSPTLSEWFMIIVSIHIIVGCCILSVKRLRRPERRINLPLDHDVEIA